MYSVEQIQIDFLQTLKAGVNNESMAEQHSKNTRYNSSEP